ncbi:GrpB family protein [Microbacterium sp.]|uniref:GrpB family protein n=1 Tax=Microbacterium sp. TaxID=51671 RepID=UPI002733C07D|nr:GrpB family protein [Microbacterium sp.]MDP3949244.1 GrpB family protein [Microbacterium sp.]
MSEAKNPAALVEHQAEWAQRASRLLSGVQDAIRGLDGAEDARLDHIGSTSVPGLAAKPFVDLQLRIAPLPSEVELVARFAPLGYVRARGSRPDPPGVDRDLPRGSIEVEPLVWEKLLFWHEDDQAILHVRRADSPWGLYTIWFRDWLRVNSDARQRYETVKRTLSVQQIGKADYDDYTLAKTEFFDQVQLEFEAWAASNH